MYDDYPHFAEQNMGAWGGVGNLLSVMKPVTL